MDLEQFKMKVTYSFEMFQKQLTMNRVSYPSRLESSGTLLLKPHNSDHLLPLTLIVLMWRIG